jgi:tRNA(fMet)-specific endonuclease VapC
MWRLAKKANAFKDVRHWSGAGQVRVSAPRCLAELTNVAVVCHCWRVRLASLALEQRVSAALCERAIAISAITRAEWRDGQMGLPPPDRRRPLIDSYSLRLPSMEWGVEAADHCGALKHALKTQGNPIGEMDTQIAAHALAENLTLVTHNTRHC